VSDRTATFERILAPEPGRTALLVVDMQRGFVDQGEAMEVPLARASVPVIRALVDLFRSKRLPWCSRHSSIRPISAARR